MEVKRTGEDASNQVVGRCKGGPGPTPLVKKRSVGACETWLCTSACKAASGKSETCGGGAFGTIFFFTSKMYNPKVHSAARMWNGETVWNCCPSCDAYRRLHLSETVLCSLQCTFAMVPSSVRFASSRLAKDGTKEAVRP